LYRDIDVASTVSSQHKCCGTEHCSPKLNLIGEAARSEERLTIIGQAEIHLSRNDVDRFLEKKLEPLKNVFRSEIFPILITRMTAAPDVPEYAHQRGIKRLYYSYEFF